MMDYIKIIDDILENSGKKYDSACIVNRDGLIEYTKRINNNFDMFLYDKGRKGKKFFEAFSDLDMSNSSILRVIATGKAASFERQILKSGNVKVVVDGDTYPIFDEKGELQGFVDAVRYLEYYNFNDKKDEVHDEALNSITTNDPHLKRIKDSLPDVAKNDSNVFLYGETGTGKGVFAKAIHMLSDRQNRPMIIQNCAAIPPNLMESTFFGTESGGFTGAENKQGLFELANHGTLFLDEINSMDVPMQAKLLTAIENGAIRRVGGQRDVPVDVRVICASNEPPAIMLQQGRFREDLYYRISSVKIGIPPLRERREDVLPLTENFIDEYNCKMGKNITGLTDMVLETFMNWTWPGNVRELRNVIESAFNYETTDKITLGSINGLLEEINARDKADAAASASGAGFANGSVSAPGAGSANAAAVANAAELVGAELDGSQLGGSRFNGSQLGEASRNAAAEIEECLSIRAVSAMLEKGSINIEDVLEDYERKIILEALRQNRKLKAAAEKLGISPQRLDYRLHKLNLKDYR